MVKLLLILFVGLLCEAAGVVLLKKGIMQIGEVNAYTAAEVFRVVKAGCTSPQLWLGILFEAIFFAGLLVLMAESDISFLWPLTGLSFVFATISAKIFLQEHISPSRWVGVMLIVVGAGFISYSEHTREKPLPAARQPAPPVK